MKEKTVASLCLHSPTGHIPGSWGVTWLLFLKVFQAWFSFYRNWKKTCCNITEIKLFLSLFSFPVKPGIQTPTWVFLPNHIWNESMCPLSMCCLTGISKVVSVTSLVIQWLRLKLSSAGDAGSTPGQGTKIPHVTLPKILKRKIKKSLFYSWLVQIKI